MGESYSQDFLYFQNRKNEKKIRKINSKKSFTLNYDSSSNDFIYLKTYDRIYFKLITDSSLSFSLNRGDTNIITKRISEITFIARSEPLIFKQCAFLGGFVGLATVGFLIATPVFTLLMKMKKTKKL